MKRNFMKSINVKSMKSGSEKLEKTMFNEELHILPNTL
jgi:hypothetical protein